MQSVGQASTQSSSLVQVSVMTYAMIAISDLICLLPPSPRGCRFWLTPIYKELNQQGGDAGH
jgi:hypothetical protein